MNAEELGYYLFMDSEEIRKREQEELNEDDKVNKSINPFLVSESPTKDRYEK